MTDPSSLHSKLLWNVGVELKCSILADLVHPLIPIDIKKISENLEEN